MLLLPRSWRPIDIVVAAVVVAVASETAAGVPVSQRLGNWDSIRLRPSHPSIGIPNHWNSIHLRPSHPAIGNPNLSVLDFNLSVRFVLENLSPFWPGQSSRRARAGPTICGHLGPLIGSPSVVHCFPLLLRLKHYSYCLSATSPPPRRTALVQSRPSSAGAQWVFQVHCAFVQPTRRTDWSG